MSSRDSSFDELKAMVKAVPIVEVIGKYIALTRKGVEFSALCPFHNEKSPSFTVNPLDNFYHCFGCGAHGDGIKFVMQMDNVDFMTAVRTMSETFGFSVSGQQGGGIKSPPKPVISKPPKPVAKVGEIEWARRKLKQSIPAKGTLVETYLKSRGIDLSKIRPDILLQLRYIELDYFAPMKDGSFKNMGKYPVMLAPMQHLDESVRAVHMTFLKPDGAGKLNLSHPEDGSALPSKKMRGASWGCAIRLGPRHHKMAISEGIENGLTYLMVEDDVSVWVAASIGNMAGKGVGLGKPHPNPLRENHRLPSVYPDISSPGIEIPLLVKWVDLIADNDGKDQLAIDAQIERAARRITLRGIKVRIIKPPVGCDLNDMVRGIKNVVHG